MENKLKGIVAKNVSFRRGEFRNDSSMVQKLPEELKRRVLQYLKEPPPGLVGDMPMIDPVTGKKYDSTNIIRDRDGFEWSSAAIYMLEHYDVKLSEEFLRLCESPRENRQ